VLGKDQGNQREFKNVCAKLYNSKYAEVKVSGKAEMKRFIKGTGIPFLNSMCIRLVFHSSPMKRAFNRKLFHEVNSLQHTMLEARSNI